MKLTFYFKNCSDDPHPGAAIAALMKLSFDEEHRIAMCQLGALHAIATLIQVFFFIHFHFSFLFIFLIFIILKYS